MSRLSKIFLITALIAATGISSCDNAPTGDFIENKAPTTYLTLEKIDREGEFRLSSQISISWWGNDSDGFIIGYEYAINDTLEGDWTFTKKTDSTFILPITPGMSQDDVLFKVRAIDNDSTRDPDGARLVFPIVNSAPSVSLNQNETPPDTLYSIVSFGWTINDPDGLGNIESTEIAVNDTVNGWVQIPIPADENRIFINLEVDNSTPGVKEAQVFLGRSFSTAPGLVVPGVEVGAKNMFFVRTTDNAGAVSEVDTVSWFVKQKTSSTLFFNDYSGNNSATVQAYHLDLLNQNGITPDIWVINDRDVDQDKVALSEAFPAVVDPTLFRTLEQWDHIYWISNDIDRNITYAQEITTRFFANGGTMFVNIPMKEINQEDEIFNFLPVDSIGVLKSGQNDFLINGNTEVNPVNPNLTDVVLRTESRQTSIYPLKPVSGSLPIYEADFKARTVIGTSIDYEGSKAMAIENQEGNLIYISLDLTNLNGNNNLADALNDLLIGRLNFKQ